MNGPPACVALPSVWACQTRLVQCGRMTRVSRHLILRSCYRMSAQKSPPSCSLTIPQVGCGAWSASCVFMILVSDVGFLSQLWPKELHPRFYQLLAHWFLLWQSTFLGQSKSNQIQGIIFFSCLALLSKGLFEGLTLHNELSLKVYFCILVAIGQCYYISVGFKYSNADLCF